jgi:protein-S-isoprenylcysteine O-methyltransferase Ste14
VLGRYFTLVLGTSPDQQVVTRGPYRALRHPGYTGLLLVVTGCAFMAGNALGVVASTTVVLAALVHRIGIEERALTEALGERYRQFARSRARLVPFVW